MPGVKTAWAKSLFEPVLFVEIFSCPHCFVVAQKPFGRVVRRRIGQEGKLRVAFLEDLFDEIPVSDVPEIFFLSPDSRIPFGSEPPQ